MDTKLDDFLCVGFLSNAIEDQDNKLTVYTEKCAWSGLEDRMWKNLVTYSLYSIKDRDCDTIIYGIVLHVH